VPPLSDRLWGDGVFARWSLAVGGATTTSIGAHRGTWLVSIDTAFQFSPILSWCSLAVVAVCVPACDVA
jgi:hypothetical protein